MLWLVGGLTLATGGCDRPDVLREGPPTIEEAAGASYSGLPMVDTSITLLNGSWSATPEPGGSSTVSVHLHRDLNLAGDVNGDARTDAVVFLTVSGGGTGDLLSMAALVRDGGDVRHAATVLIGDRVQIRSADLNDGVVKLDIVQAGPQDAMCCPGDLVTRSWEWKAGTWAERPAVVTGRWSVSLLDTTTWILTAWDQDEPKLDSVEVSLRYEDGRIFGSAGCNRYFADLSAGSMPGELSIGQAGATKMMCPPDQMAVEDRFLSILPRIRSMRFMEGRLALVYNDGERLRSLIFDPGPM